MRPICFFPFTYMSEDQITTVTAFFRQTRFLNLSPEVAAEYEPAVGQGRLLPINLPPHRIEAGEGTVRAYLDWAGLHRGNERNLRALIRNADYFREDTGLSSIQSQIRQGVSGTPDDSRNPGSDPLLFLKLAEIWDRENNAIQQDLRRLDAGNQALIAELKGEVPAAEAAPGRRSAPEPGSDPGSNMTGERIKAWFTMAMDAGLTDWDGDGPLMVTTSRAVADHLERMADDVINWLDIESIKVHDNGCACGERWQQEIREILELPLSSNGPAGKNFSEESDCCPLSGQISLSVLSGNKLEQTLNFSGRRLAVCLVKLNS